MKNLLYSLSLILISSSYIFCQTPQVFIDQQAHTGVVGGADLTGFSTFRLFAQLDNTSQELVSIIGEESLPAFVQTTTSFYQDSFGNSTGSQINSAFYPFVPALEYDSYVTVGYSSSTTVGIPFSEEPTGNVESLLTNAITAIEDPNAPWIENFESGGNIDLTSLAGGGWFNLPGNQGNFGVGVNNSVLIGQFTTDGNLSFCLNVQVLENDESTLSEVCGSGLNASCGDDTACNYDSQALEVNNDLCIYAGSSCDDGDLNTLSDTLNENCVCQGLSAGCNDPEAYNYSPDAQEDDGSCLYENACEDAVEITIDGASVLGNNEGAADENDATEQGSCWGLEGDAGDVWFYFVGNGSPVDIETFGLDTQIAVYDSCGGQEVACDEDSGISFASLISGFVALDGQDYFIEVEGWGDSVGEFTISVTTGEINSENAGCTDMASCNYDPDWTLEDDFCLYPNSPCDDGNALTVNDTIDDSCNCVGDVMGCTDNAACNFANWATLDDGSCTFPGDTCDDNDTATLNDTLQDNCTCQGISGGCTDSTASNYDPNAPEDDGSCCYGDYLTVTIYDSFGDGGGAFDLLDNFENSISSGSLTDGEGPATFDICLTDGCYLYELIEDFWPQEISADVSVNGEIVFQHQMQDSFDQYPIVINVGDDPECIIYGCTDNTACNYSGLATEDDGSCDFDYCVGCSQPGATNYDVLVTQDDGSCSYDISGVVFIDDNYNGVADPFEDRLSYQNIAIEPGGIQVITDDEGNFMVSGLEEGDYSVSVNYTGSWTNNTTPTDYSLSFPLDGGAPVYFGVTNETVPAPSACVDFYQWGFGVPCNDVLNYNICYRNMSPYPVSGVVEIVLDDLISYNNSVPPAENVEGQTISWSFTDLSPWEMYFDDILVNTPSEQEIGEFMTSSVTIYIDYEGELLPVTTEEIVQEVTCAYDPNDITGIPEGYTEDHLVLADTRMEYLIRFQNTGNAPAGTVMVVDTLDVDMDFSTFQLMANSHSVMTTIEPSGRVEFLFENINLPDSVNNEPESHGMVSFKIDFLEGIATGEELNQTAHIFFDNNPAVVTNTTWHTIHECGGESAFDLSSSAVCAGETVTLSSTEDLVEDHQWNIDSSPASTDAGLNLSFEEAGDYIIQHVAENPICSESSMQLLTVYDLPVAEVTEEGALLTATEGESYQWYMNGEAIIGATEQSHLPVDDGNYTVAVTGEGGCTTESEAVMIVGIIENDLGTIMLYPNPMSGSAILAFENREPKTIQLLDNQGKVVRTWKDEVGAEITLQRENLASGQYTITVTQGQAMKQLKLIIR